jgi:cytochrome c oxidase subunit 2
LVKKPPVGPDLSKDELMAKGKEVFAVNCSGCHGENGEGVPETFPALKGSKVAKGPLAQHLRIVLDGKDDTAMQPWKDQLSAEEIAAVITFERNAWGNDTGDVVQAAAVEAAK